MFGFACIFADEIMDVKSYWRNVFRYGFRMALRVLHDSEGIEPEGLSPYVASRSDRNHEKYMDRSFVNGHLIRFG